MIYGKIHPVLDRLLIIASGPSGAGLVIPDGLPVMAVNGAIDGLPRADYWFTLDPSPVNKARMAAPKPGTSYLCATGVQMAGRIEPHVVFLRRKPGRGLSVLPDTIYTGNSGFGALQVGVFLGAKRIGLIGIDATDDNYWHGPGKSKSLINLPTAFAAALPQLMRKGVEVRVGSIFDKPRLKCFPAMTPSEVIQWLTV